MDALKWLLKRMLALLLLYFYTLCIRRVDEENEWNYAEEKIDFLFCESTAVCIQMGWI